MRLLGEGAEEADLLESAIERGAAQPKSQQPRLAAVVAGASILLLLLLAGGGTALWGWGPREADVVNLVSRAEEAPGAHHPKYARVNGTIETLWQRPHGTVKGLFFAAHGCCHQAPDYFSEEEPDGWKFEACAETISGSCLGLPEEVRFRRAVLSRGYVFTAVSGGSGNGSCWYFKDLARIKAAVEYVRKEENLESTPVFATGSSSGGQLMQPLAEDESQGGLPDLRCVVPMVSPSDETVRGVPTLFVYMSRDSGTSYMVNDQFGDFVVDGIRAGEIEAKPMPLTPAFLGRCISADLGNAVIEALHEADVIDKDGYLKADARKRAWVEPTRRAIAGKSRDTLIPDKSCLSELMNVAWSFHEFTGEYSEEIIDFCEGRWNGTFSG